MSTTSIFLSPNCFWLHISLLFISCASSSTANNQPPRKPYSDSSIVLIIKNKVNHQIQLSYLTPYNESETVYSGTGNDTLRFESINFLPLKILAGQNNIMYPLMPSDTLTIDINSSQELHFTRVSNDVKEFDTAFIKFINVRLAQEYSLLRTINSTIFPPAKDGGVSITKIMPGKDKEKFIALKTQAIKINNEEWKIIDSLFNAGTISRQYRSVYGSLINSQCVNNIIICYQNTKDDELIKLLGKENIHFFNNDFVIYDAGAYKQMINNYLTSIIERDKFSKYGKNGITIDYRDAFKKASGFFAEPLLGFVQFVCLKNIKEQYPDKEFQNYLTEYSQGNTVDSAYINYFRDHFLTVNGPGENLYSSSMAAYQLSDVMQKKYIGNVLYIDLWASWCKPCREAMPESLNLQKKYGNSPLKFIYISLDQNISSWKNASKSESLYNYPTSFILDDPKNSQFLKKIKLESIPRFLLIDKKGKLVNNNAPPPGSSELTALIESLF